MRRTSLRMFVFAILGLNVFLTRSLHAQTENQTYEVTQETLRAMETAAPEAPLVEPTETTY